MNEELVAKVSNAIVAALKADDDQYVRIDGDWVRLDGDFKVAPIAMAAIEAVVEHLACSGQLSRRTTHPDGMDRA